MQGLNQRTSRQITPEKDISIRALTRGPKFHWFGYYDKLQFGPSTRYALGMEADFEHRRPTADDTITVGMIDLREGDKWIELGGSCAWCWQMGCMLQWRPGSDSEVMWNDRDGDTFVSHILNIDTGQKKTLPFAFFSVHPSGKTALGLDFARLEYMRPGYGYAGLPDPNQDVLAPDNAGIYLLDLEAGRRQLIISFAQLAAIPDSTRSFADCKHYCNCLLFNPSGSRFVFLHRWRTDKGRGWPFKTRMITAAADGSDPYILVPGGCGHFNWIDDKHLIVQDGGFSVYRDRQGRIEQIGKGIVPDSGGHVSYLPGGKWMVGDTYPDSNRNQHLYLFNLTTNELLSLGSFYEPPEYSGTVAGRGDDEWRCDLHPRISPDGRLLTVDSPHGGNGRQIYLVDISRIVS